jgi:hypothetical protein
VSDTVSPRTDRVDFRATTDPSLLESADRGEANLLDYGQLYSLWERQQWAVQDIDFTQEAGGEAGRHQRAPQPRDRAGRRRRAEAEVGARRHETEIFGISIAETRLFAFSALERRMKVIGLVAAG